MVPHHGHLPLVRCEADKVFDDGVDCHNVSAATIELLCSQANVLSCEPCQVGEFCPAGSVVGTPCPLRYTTEGRGAEKLDDCGCPAGTFDDEISCEPCVADRMNCTRTGLTLATVPLPPSRWRLSV